VEQFIMIYRPPRPTFPGDATAEESSAVERHFEYLKSLHAQERLIIAGRTEDATMGIAVFLAKDEAEAQRIMADDPAVSVGVFKGEIKKYRVALLGRLPE
jgi:uncharacterized protein YciI